MSLTTRYLALAGQLLGEAQARPDEQTRLTYAAGVAQRLAELARDEDAVQSGHLESAAALIEPGLSLGIPASAVEGARVYAGMAVTYAAQQRDQRQEVHH